MEEKDPKRRAKECPLCAENMRIRTHELSERIPGMSQTVKRMVREWECPDCSYEEEVEDDEEK